MEQDALNTVTTGLLVFSFLLFDAGCAVVANRVHIPNVVGSNPIPATNSQRTRWRNPAGLSTMHTCGLSVRDDRLQRSPAIYYRVKARPRQLMLPPCMVPGCPL